MSASAKKISQLELRKFMCLHKRKALDSSKRIESPLAKYSEDGVLTCILCNSVVKADAVWNIHINSKQHKDNIARKSQTTVEQELPFLPPPKKPVAIPTPAAKPTKSILKNATPLPPKFFDDLKIESDDVSPAKKVKIEVNEPPNESSENSQNEGEDAEEKEEESPQDSELPEGFFDDPILDAKARNVEYKDPVEEEWERFQKEIKEETDLSAKLIHEDTEDATVQRQIEQIDEQISKLSRVVQLEMKKHEVKAKVLSKPEIKKEEPSADDSDDSDLDAEFDWRAKSYLS